MKKFLSLLLVMIMALTVMLVVIPPMKVEAASIMSAQEFADKCYEIATEYKTLYVMGCFGAPMNSSNKERYISNYGYNQGSDRKNKINAASSDTFGFDCVCLIKGVLWGWNGDKNKIYGGATYASKGVSDMSIDTMLSICTGVSTDFSKVEVGEILFYKDSSGYSHVGVYIGNGLAVESTPIWKDGVQVTAVLNQGSKSGYNGRTWYSHGKLTSFLTYHTCTEFEGLGVCKECGKTFNWEKTLDTTVAGTYTVSKEFTPRTNAPYNDATKASTTIKKNSKVAVIGVYTNAYNNKWYKFTYNNGQSIGYVHAPDTNPYLTFSTPNALNVQATGFKPSSNASLSLGQSYTASGTISSNYPLKTVEAYLDGNKYTTWTASDQKTTSLNIQSTVISSKLNFANMSLGTHTIKLKATDVHNQTSTFFTVSFNIVNNPANNTLRVNYHVNGGTITGSNYYLSDSMVYLKSTSQLVAFVCQYGVKVDNGLHNDTTFGLVRDGYKFVGWSLTADGSGEIFDQDMPCKPEDLVPDLVNGNKTVTMYAIWEKIGCDHSYTYKSNSSGHWKECVQCGEKQTTSSHTYTNDCDKSCNTCGYTRTTSHTYSNSCDTSCNVCGYTRTTTHTYTNSCDKTCNVCGSTRTITHTYNHDCDTDCNVCGETRTTAHSYGSYSRDSDHHWRTCTICNSSVISQPHYYTNKCDTSCNACGYERTITHSYDNDCDTGCNVCGEARTTEHVYDDEQDTTCNVCSEVRTVETLPSNSDEAEPSTKPGDKPDTDDTQSSSNKKDNDDNNDEDDEDEDNDNTTIIVVAIAGAVTVSAVSILGTALVMKKKR